MEATRTVGRPTQLDSVIPQFFEHFIERGFDGRRLDMMLAAALKYSDRTVRRVRTEGQGDENFKIRLLAAVRDPRAPKLFNKSLSRWEGDYVVGLVVQTARENGWRG